MTKSKKIYKLQFNYINRRSDTPSMSTNSSNHLTLFRDLILQDL